ncbi:MAG: hypothetical protein ABJC26_13345, partial [Gemmatimonadaceae bacterium]
RLRAVRGVDYARTIAAARGGPTVPAREAFDVAAAVEVQAFAGRREQVFVRAGVAPSLNQGA